jgi:hypothetical protein
MLTEVSVYQFNIQQNGTYSLSLPMLKEDVKDWSTLVECGMKFYERGGVYTEVLAASISVSSVATQAASIFAESATVTYELTTSSTTSGLVTTDPTATATGLIPPTDNGGLSTGAKAGIGVGIGVSALLVAAAAYLLYRNHRKLKDLNARLSYQSQAQQYSKPPGVAVADTGGNERERPFSQVTMQSEGHQSLQAPRHELGAIP